MASDDDVVVFIAIHFVGTQTADQQIAALAAGDRIIAAAAVRNVVSDSTIEGVVVTPAQKQVVAVLAFQVVVADAAIERVVARTAGQCIVTISTNEAGRERQSNGPLRHLAAQVEHEGLHHALQWSPGAAEDQPCAVGRDGR